MHLNVYYLFLDTTLLPDNFCAFVSFSYSDSTNFTSQRLVSQSKPCGGLKATPSSVLCHRQMPVRSTCTGQWHSKIWQVWVSSGAKEMQLQPHTLLDCPQGCINPTPILGEAQTRPAPAEACMWKEGLCLSHCVRQPHHLRDSLPLTRWQELFIMLRNNTNPWSKKFKPPWFHVDFRIHPHTYTKQGHIFMFNSVA